MESAATICDSVWDTDSDIGSPDDIEALKAALVAEKVRAAQAEAELAIARAKASDDQGAGLPERSWPIKVAKLRNRTVSPVVERFITCATTVANSISIDS